MVASTLSAKPASGLPVKPAKTPIYTHRSALLSFILAALTLSLFVFWRQEQSLSGTRAELRQAAETISQLNQTLATLRSQSNEGGIIVKGDAHLRSYYYPAQNSRQGLEKLSLLSNSDLILELNRLRTYNSAMESSFPLLLAAVFLFTALSGFCLFRYIQAKKTIDLLSKASLQAKERLAEIDGSGSELTRVELNRLNESLRSRVEDLDSAISALQIAYDDALAVSRLKSQMIANVSHEIRTPMSGVLGMSELLMENKLDDDSQTLVRYISESAKNLLVVVNDLLDFSKLEAGRIEIDKEELSIKLLLEGVVHSVLPEAQKKGVVVKGSVGTTVPSLLFGDPGRIRQVVLNLAHNAVKFTTSGSVQLTAEVLRSEETNFLIRFQVIDTGIGIDGEALNLLFKPFAQAHGSPTKKYGGTGLGLSICKALVELMHGEIGVSSRLAEGSTFWFDVPLKTIED